MACGFSKVLLPDDAAEGKQGNGSKDPSEYHMGVFVIARPLSPGVGFPFAGNSQVNVGIVWEARDPEIDKLIDDLLKVGQEIMKRIGIDQRVILPIPAKGNLRIFLMAFDGSCFGEGFYDNLYQDEMGRYGINASYNLMIGLIKKQEKNRKAA